MTDTTKNDGKSRGGFETFAFFVSFFGLMLGGGIACGFGGMLFGVGLWFTLGLVGEGIEDAIKNK